MLMLRKFCFQRTQTVVATYLSSDADQFNLAAVQRAAQIGDNYAFFAILIHCAK